jgi:hypothetical protein
VPITVIGSEDNTMLASWTDPAGQCRNPEGNPTRFHWVINTPNTNGYTSRGITGYRTDALGVLADSIPNFGTTFITVLFSVTSGATADDGNHPSRTVSFRFVYQDTQLTVLMSTTCQQLQSTNEDCEIEAALAVPPGTET